ncbi:hypothetical protein BDN70DRAFT_268280 [Pholiota conissans]|uniref:Uncharacterized protein n=1 Tax=Pholiota conissans TaxID=109636 RepID=A0A9P6CQN3_9AGAR|nr:hypothetical protein BDN70DRAFT_268280 [Pholiota conissans]
MCLGHPTAFGSIALTRYAAHFRLFRHIIGVSSIIPLCDLAGGDESLVSRPGFILGVRAACCQCRSRNVMPSCIAGIFEEWSNRNASPLLYR